MLEAHTICDGAQHLRGTIKQKVEITRKEIVIGPLYVVISERNAYTLYMCMRFHLISKQIHLFEKFAYLNKLLNKVTYLDKSTYLTYPNKFLNKVTYLSKFTYLSSTLIVTDTYTKCSDNKGCVVT